MKKLSMTVLFVGVISSISSLRAFEQAFQIVNLGDDTIYVGLYRGGAAADEPVPQSEVVFGRNATFYINKKMNNVLGIWKNTPKNPVTYDTKTQTFFPKADQIYTFDTDKTLFLYWNGNKVVSQSIKPKDKMKQHFLERAGVSPDQLNNNVTTVNLRV